MSTPTQQVVEAYIINDDGTQTRIPAGFANTSASASSAEYGTKASRSPFGWTFRRNNPESTSSSRTSLHLGRRLAGVFLVAIGIPMLVLPGPGLATIAAGVALIVAP